MKYLVLLFFLCVSTTLLGQISDRIIPIRPYDWYIQPPEPDFSSSHYWAALPSTADFADNTPKGLADRQDAAQADVFFVHPTTYTGKNKNQNQWNANLHDPALNRKTDESTIKYQASIFNGAGRVYAPRYRQAHIYSYFATDTASANAAFNLAYSDVKKAFEFYLEHYNEGRPIIIAAHSQGTTHSIRLVKEFFDGTALQEKLVAAYLVGMPVKKNAFENIPPCESEEQTNCFCSWRTFAQGYYPPAPWDKYIGPNFLVTNPLTWSSDTLKADYDMNKGGVLKKFNKVRPNVIDAQVHEGLLWVNKPKVFGTKLVNIKNYHAGDLNLFYMNVRDNAILRVRKFLGIEGELSRIKQD